jgi:hypothetical protein
VNTRPYDYIAYIDESGDPGLKFVRPIDPKGSEWFVMSAVVVHADREAEVIAWLRDLMPKFRSPQMQHVHFRKLNDLRKTIACPHIAGLPLRAFVMASNKRNMRRYRNPFPESRSLSLVGAQQTYRFFYYWASRILLEKVSDFVFRESMKRYGEPRKLRLEFSQNGSLRFDEVSEYLKLLRMHHIKGTQFVKKDDLRYEVMDGAQILRFDPKERAGLQLADIVASAFFKACDVHEYRKSGSDFCKAFAPPDGAPSRHNGGQDRPLRRQTHAGHACQGEANAGARADFPLLRLSPVKKWWAPARLP